MTDELGELFESDDCTKCPAEHDPAIEGREIQAEITDGDVHVAAGLSYREANELAVELAEAIPDDARTVLLGGGTDAE